MNADPTLSRLGSALASFLRTERVRRLREVGLFQHVAEVKETESAHRSN